MFLIYGEDSFLIKTQKNKILAKINLNDEYEVEEYSYLEKPLLDIINDANTVAMFSDKRIIVINDCFFLTEEKINAKVDNKEYLPNLLEYLENPNPNTYLIFICPVNNISNRLKITKKMLALTSVLKAINLSYPELLKFINDFIAKHHATISQHGVEKIIEYLPNNLYIIQNELRKLILVDSHITEEIIENNITKYLDTDIFKLVDYLLNNDLNNFLINYHYLQERGLNNIALLALIANSVILTRDIIILSATKKTHSDIASTLKIHPYWIKKNSERLNKFNIEKANKIIIKLFEIDYKIKKGIINKDISSDLFLINLFDLNE